MNEDTQLTLGEASRIGLPLRWLVAIGIAIAAGGGGVALANARFSAIESRQDKDEGRLTDVEKAAQSHAIHDASVDADLRNIRTSLEAIDRKLDRMMERRGLQQARDER